MCELRLPATLTPLFAGLPRRVEVDAETVAGAIDELDRRWPGVRDRLLEPGPAIRQHIQVWVDTEPAALDTPVERGSQVYVIAAITGG
jgi:sulfur-carrier protein